MSSLSIYIPRVLLSYLISASSSKHCLVLENSKDLTSEWPRQWQTSLTQVQGARYTAADTPPG